MWKSLLMLLSFVLIPVFVGAEPFTYKDCGKQHTIDSVNVNNCTKNPCILKKGTNAGIEVVFTAQEDSNKSTSKAYGMIAGIPVPFLLPDTNGCKGMTPSCPIKKGTQYKYKTSLMVKTSYPSIKLAVKWEEVADDGNSLFCLIFEAELE